MTTVGKRANSSRNRERSIRWDYEKLNKIAAHDGVVPRAQDGGHNAHGQILLRFPETMDAGAEAGKRDF